MFSISWLLCAAMLWTGDHCSSLHTTDLSLNELHGDASGEFWYAVSVRNTPIGSLRETRTKLPGESYELSKSLRFRLTAERETRVDETLRFAAGAPHRLIFAEQVTILTQAGVQHVTRHKLASDELTHPNFERYNYTRTFPFHHATINDSLRATSASVNFANKSVASIEWRLMDPTSTDSNVNLVRTDGMVEQEVSKFGIPLRSSSADGLELRRTDRENALSWQDREPLLSANPISISVDRRLPNPRQLVSLTMRLEADVATKSLWSPMISTDDLITIDRRLPPHVKVETLGNQQIPQLVAEKPVAILIEQTNLERTATRESIQQLVTFLYEYLAYEDIDFISTIAQTIERKTGDCTEFADVFDAVAAHLGWRSRIRTGLAYDSPTQTFRVHSWNEVVVNDQWLTADASWGQFPADASHVPFPPTNMLALLVRASNMRFVVVDREYTSD